jgi:UDP-N-acetylglucosamine 1-carboxyvinyltransferase
MATLRIEGGRRLSGAVTVEGNKNAALPLIAACLLTEEECVLENVPRIRDVEVLLRIQCRALTTERPDPVLVGKLRGSVLLLGPLLARKGAARLAPPGGDFPTRRTISTHLQALLALGAVLVDEPGHALDAPDGLTGASFYLDEASVTGTETAVLAAAVARGRTEIRHAARRRALRVPSFDGRGYRRNRNADDPRRGRGPVQRRDPPAERRLHRSRELGRGGGDHRR